MSDAGSAARPVSFRHVAQIQIGASNARSGRDAATNMPTHRLAL
jgi:hypothetical protein